MTRRSVGFLLFSTCVLTSCFYPDYGSCELPGGDQPSYGTFVVAVRGDRVADFSGTARVEADSVDGVGRPAPVRYTLVLEGDGHSFRFTFRDSLRTLSYADEGPDVSFEFREGAGRPEFFGFGAYEARSFVDMEVHIVGDRAAGIFDARMRSGGGGFGGSILGGGGLHIRACGRFVAEVVP